MEYRNLPLIIIGTEGASKETYYLIKKINNLENISFNVLGFIERESSRIGETIFDGQKIIGTDETVRDIISTYMKVGIVIPIGDPATKERIFKVYQGLNNVIFPNIIHPDATFEGEVKLGIGNIISAGTVLACDLKLGDFNLINRCCTTGHDVMLGNFNTLNPASVISGNVTIKNKCLIGARAVVLQGLTIEDNVVLGAGAVLTTSAQSGDILVGIPAKRRER